MKVKVPPIKSQGIKTKLVPWIRQVVPKNIKGRWIEPFMGTGVVAFNIAPKKAILSDINPHLINFYNSISNGDITAEKVRKYLEKEGALLVEKGESHYYYIRDRFNKYHSPLDFLFLNRSGFNGMIRFNKKGEYNIPFCKKINRFSKAYITKIVNQVDYISKLLKFREFEFVCESFENIIRYANEEDVIYCDPPYIDRHVDYYNGWNEEEEMILFDILSRTKAKFILSTWHHNAYRKNKYIDMLWGKYNIFTREHFYHVGGMEKNRSSIVEAIVINYEAEFEGAEFIYSKLI